MLRKIMLVLTCLTLTIQAQNGNYMMIPENTTFIELNRPVKIMPIGNSITAGTPGDASYRYWLWKQLDTTGYRGKVDFVGSMHGVFDESEPKYPDFDQDHEGHPGYMTNEVEAGMHQYFGLNVPDILLLHLGTNDVTRETSHDTTIKYLGRIIDSARNHNPSVIVIIAKLIPATSYLRGITTLNSAIPNLALQKTTYSSPVIVLDQNTGFTASDLSDGIHLRESGEQKFASRWYTALKFVLDKVVGKPLEISPASGNFISEQRFDIAVFQRQQASVISYSVYLDNVKVYPYAKWVQFADGTSYYRIGNIRGQDIGGSGKHIFKISARLSNGCTIADSTVWNIK